MTRSGGGHVVNIASIAGIRATGSSVPYAASKAALNQLARVAALEWAGDNIRINVVHPNAVYDTGIWSEAVLRDRATHYGISVEEYKRRSTLLGVEVTSRDVAELTNRTKAAHLAKTNPTYRTTLTKAHLSTR